MRTLTRLVVAAAVGFGAAGCGKDKSDNTPIQTPNDQPLGMPKGFGGGPGRDGKQLVEKGGAKFDPSKTITVKGLDP
jgi:hypothetical protein